MQADSSRLMKALCACLLCGCAQLAQAQSEQGSVSAAVRGIAASSIQTPVAYRARWRTAGFGFYGQTAQSPAGNSDVDGGLGFALGLGDPDQLVGADLAVSSASLSRSEGGSDGFGDSGSFGIKLHRNLPWYTSVAIGANGFGRWGKLKDNSDESYYAVLSRFLNLGGPYGVVVNLGAGNEAYADPGKNGVQAIGSLAFYYTTRFSLLVEHTGRFTNAGLSVAPVSHWPATITMGVTNLGQRLGLDTEFALSVGLGFGY
ncbi:hypothetical protein WQQ_30070 [Hydrocarboniphaga effusa AP103]|uniref:Outer membrane protein beta-barrel domain-containing protein n=2 Tax=Nevskiaceae TaxID=568386 RepID=I8T650_9GAMM|nr:hypothetical protein WQQ_30070 [Hydrocarboniphaga effusa AP103]